MINNIESQYCVNVYFPTQVIKRIPTVNRVEMFEPICICNGENAKEQAIKIAKLLESDRINTIH